MLKILINQQKQIEQNKKNDLEKVFIKENENWYETILHEIKNLQIEKIDNLMICEWSYWITCHEDKCKEHQHMKKQNQYYLQKSWKYRSQNKEN